MYEQYWGLKQKPFENIPDPRFFYWSGQHDEAFARLFYAVNEQKGAGLLSGAFGCGKTLVAHALMEKLSKEQYALAFLPIPPRTFTDLLRSVVRHLKKVPLPQSESADVWLEMFEETLENNYREKRRTVIIMDELHVMNDEVFEGLRLLLNFSTQDGFKLSLLMLGQPELEDKIQNLKPLEQRIAIKAKLQPFDLEESQKYITQRLNLAGATKEIFTAKAVELIHKNAGGIPRRINRLCDIALLSGYSKRVIEIDFGIIEEETSSLTGSI